MRYLPRPWSPQDDQRLQQELRRTDDLPADALLLTRATGMRIGECIRLPLDCLRQSTDPTNGHCMFPSANSTLNGWSPTMPTRGA